MSFKELQNKIIKCTNHLSDVTKLKVKDNFIQDILYRISEQEIEIEKFAVDYKLKMSSHAGDLIRFAESCEGDDISSDELLESIRKLNDDKLNENKTDLLNQIVNVKNSLSGIGDEIAEYNKKIAEGHTGWTNKINEANQNIEEATTLAKTSLMIVGIGAIAATAGASLAVVIPAKVIGMCLVSQGTTMVSSVIAGASLIYKNVLNDELKGVKRQTSQLQQEMQQVLEDVNEIIKHCEFNFKKQIAEIEEVEKIVGVIKTLDDKHLVRPIARTISTRARKNSIGYDVGI